MTPTVMRYGPAGSRLHGGTRPSNLRIGNDGGGNAGGSGGEVMLLRATVAMPPLTPEKPVNGYPHNTNANNLIYSFKTR